jgi:hypothetical protein
MLGRIQPDLQARFPANTYLSIAPTETRVFVRPNRYEPGRANIVVYNWGKLPSINMNLMEAGLKNGDRYEIRDSANYFGSPVAVGTYTGQPVSVPMMALRVARPVGQVPSNPVHTAPDFAVFIVLKRDADRPADAR